MQVGAVSFSQHATKLDVIVGNRNTANKVYPIESTVANVDLNEFTLALGTTTDVGAASGGGRTDDTRTVTVSASSSTMLSLVWELHHCSPPCVRISATQHSPGRYTAASL